MKLLNNNISPDVLKKMSVKQLNKLCAEIRLFLIKTVSKTGGHLASNLGTVELTVALHKVYSSPKDKFVFDVGHQAYTHKILTGRLRRFSTLRSEGGISGFPRPSESVHDSFIGGHSGISVSAALGIAEALRLSGDRTSKTIAIAGDGSFTDGGIYEGLNNAGKSRANLLVILNDNDVCISKNAGAISAYLSHLRATRKYYRAKTNVKNMLEKTKTGEALSGAVSGAKKFVKNAIYKSNLFENLGFAYYGPVDGHNLAELIEVLELAKLINRPCLIHVKTKKGKGYRPAEINPGEYHGVNKEVISEEIDSIKTIKKAPKSPKSEIPETGASVFGKEIAKLGGNDENIILITAAMKYATGCNYFNDLYPERFYDCGIAEGHAATFAAGLASMGKLPVFAVYSTFSQRCFDRLIHDVSIENLHVILAIDRAGAVGEDGETHQGIFDVSMLSIIPNFTTFSPFTAEELRTCLKRALYEVKGPVAVRYPRGQLTIDNGQWTINKDGDFKQYKGDGGQLTFNGEQLTINKDGDFKVYKRASNFGDKLSATYGRITGRVLNNDNSDVMQLIKIQPLCDEAIDEALKYKTIVFYEEGVRRGGIGELFAYELVKRGFKGDFELKAFNGFLPVADAESQLNSLFD